MGNYFITGNHEYYSGAKSWVNEVRRLGIKPRKQHVLVGDDSATRFSRVTDYTAGRFSWTYPVLKRLERHEQDQAVVLLAHQPKEIDNAAAHEVSLQIPVTHGGQIWPFNVLVHMATVCFRAISTQ